MNKSTSDKNHKWSKIGDKDYHYQHSQASDGCTEENKAKPGEDTQAQSPIGT